MRLIIGLAGASGVIYGIRLLEILREMADVETHLVMSRTAKLNVGIETERSVDDVVALADVVYRDNDMAASIASGSFRTDGMIVAACSMKSLSAIVHSHTDTLLSRAADVTLKEGRRLVLMPRETPLHAGHCKLLYEAALMGAVVAPPLPAFYARPETLADMIDQTLGRVLELFGLDAAGVYRWKGIREH